MKEVDDKLEDVAGFLGLAIKELEAANKQLKQDSNQFYIDCMEEMCVQSLAPENYERWEAVKEGLKISRKHLG